MSWFVLLESKNAQTTTREVKKRCAPHCAEPDYHRVVAPRPDHDSCTLTEIMETPRTGVTYVFDGKC